MPVSYVPALALRFMISGLQPTDLKPKLDKASLEFGIFIMRSDSKICQIIENLTAITQVAKTLLVVCRTFKKHDNKAHGGHLSPHKSFMAKFYMKKRHF